MQSLRRLSFLWKLNGNKTLNLGLRLPGSFMIYRPNYYFSQSSTDIVEEEISDSFEAFINVGLDKMRVSRYQDAIKVFQRSLQKEAQSAKENPDTTSFIHLQIANCLLQLKIPSQAIEILEKGFDLKPKGNILIADYHRAFGQAYLAEEQYDKALSHFEKAIETLKSLQDIDHAMSEIALINNDMGLLYLKQNKFSEAQNCIQESLSQYQLSKEIDNLELAKIYENQGLLFHQQKEYKKAIDSFKKGLETIRKTEREHEVPLTAELLWRIGGSYKQLNEEERTLQYFNDAWRIFHEIFGEENRIIVDFLIEYAELLSTKNKVERAIQYYKEVITILTTSEESSQKLLRVLELLNNLLIKNKKFQDAEKYLQIQITMLLHEKGPESFNLLSPYINMATILMDSKPKEALTLSWRFQGNRFSFVFISDYCDSII